MSILSPINEGRELGSEARIILSDGSDTCDVTSANALKVDGSAVTQPMTISSLPLPTGAATSANQTTEITSLQLIDNLPHSMNGSFTSAVPIGGQLDDTTTTVATENNIAPLRITAQRAAHVNLRDDSGVEFGTVANPFNVVSPYGVHFVLALSLNAADTYTTTANGVTQDVSSYGPKYFSIQVKGTGAAATTWDVRLEGSNDSVNFTQIIQHTQVDLDGTVKFSADAIPRPVLYYRTRCAGLVLGAASDIVVTVAGVQ